MESQEFSEKVKSKYTTEIIDDVASQMRNGVDIKDRRHYFKLYPACFLGSDLVSWMIENNHGEDIDEAIEIGNYFMEHNVFHHVLRDHKLKNQNLFYRFEVDETDRGHADKEDTWFKILDDHNGEIILPEDVERVIGEQTDWHIKSPGAHHFHEILVDAYNWETLDNCRPIKWSDPSITTKYDMIAIGAGAGGLVTTIGASLTGGKAAIIERNISGGDWLNTGWVPSKAFIKSAKIAHAWKTAQSFGIKNGEVEVDFPKVMERVREIRAKISHADSVHKLAKKYGIDVFLGHAKFTSPNEIEVNGKTLQFSKAWIATGASPLIPDIEGLNDSPYLTSENVFNITEQPKKLLVIGAGPIGCELGQSFVRLGTSVTIITSSQTVLPKEDPEAAALVHSQMVEDGVQFYFQASIKKVTTHRDSKGRKGDHATVEIEVNGEIEILQFDSILISTGRKPNVNGMGLEDAGVEFDDVKGVEINDNWRSSNKNVYAVGDWCSKFQFTHNADAMARIVIKNALFFGSEKYSNLNMPWCTYTDPEVAHVGRYEHEMDQSGTKYDIYKANFSHNDRAIWESVDGFVKIYTKHGSDVILGCTIVGGPAGDMICSVSTAMLNKVGLSTFGTAIHPYPTYAEAFKALSSQYNIKKLGPGTKSFLRALIGIRR